MIKDLANNGLRNMSTPCEKRVFTLKSCFILSLSILFTIFPKALWGEVIELSITFSATKKNEIEHPANKINFIGSRLHVFFSKIYFDMSSCAQA